MTQINSKPTTVNKGAFYRIACLSPVLVFALSLFFWHEVREIEDDSLERASTTQAESLTDFLRVQFHEDLHSLRRMEKRWEREGGTPRDLWLADAEQYFLDHEELVGVGWVDSEHFLRWIVPAKGNEEAEGLKLSFEARREDAMLRARSSGEHALSRPVTLVQGGQGMLAIFSLEIDGESTGFISAAIDPKKWINKTIGQSSKQFHVRVTEKVESLYERDDEKDLNSAPWKAGPIVDIAGVQLKVFIRPTLATVASYRSAAPLAILASGVLIAIMLAVTVRFWRQSLDREVQIKKSQERFDRAVNGTSDGLWEWVVGTNTVWYARRFKEMLGYEDHEFPNTLEAFREHLHPDDIEPVFASIKQHIATREEYNIDYRLRNKEGQYIWCHARASIVDDLDRKVALMSGSIHDITDRKAAALEIAQRNQDLETLLHVTSHDLREPLRAIRNFSQLLQSDHGNELDEEGADFLQRIIRGGDRLDNLLDDILKLSRAQRADVDDLTFNLRKSVDAAMQRLTEQIESTHANVQIDPALPVVHGDPTWITQAIYNILSNAMKFTSAGESPIIEITAIRSQTEHDLTGLAVHDRGTGIPANCVDKIFTLFQRAVGREIPGTGAGLAIVRQIIERHHGRVWYEPREGGGSSFFVLLPAANEPLPSETKTGNSEAAA